MGSTAFIAVLVFSTVFAAPLVNAIFKYERSIAFSVQRMAALGTSTASREITGFSSDPSLIYINIGGSFNVVTGRFKAPLDGVYAFYYSFSSSMMGVTTTIELLKLKGGEAIDKAVSLVNQTITPSTPTPLEFSSASALVDLKRNDQVLLRLAPGALDATRDRPLIFTGYMVYRTGQEHSF